MGILVLIDNGHGEDTKGKRSPDGRLLEYSYTREIAAMVSRKLTLGGIETQLLTPEKYDVGIRERVRRANGWSRKRGAGNVLLVSIHLNAMGCGDWHEARGWLVMVDDAASQRSKDLADLLFDETKARGLKTRQYVAGRKWMTYGEAKGSPGSRLGILKNTLCPAVLTENFFQDNKEDVAFLLSDEGKEAVADIHVQAIRRCVAEAMKG